MMRRIVAIVISSVVPVQWIVANGPRLDVTGFWKRI